MAPSAGTAPRTFDDRAFRNALGRFATGVIVVTAGPRRDPHAMTANAFMSGSLDPPLLVVSVARKARMHDRLAGARRFGVSILGREQEPASRHFAGQTVQRFAPAFGVLAGVPVLAGAAVVIAVRVERRYACGDHTLVVGRGGRPPERGAGTGDTSPPAATMCGRYGAVQRDQSPGRDPRVSTPTPCAPTCRTWPTRAKRGAGSPITSTR